MSKNNMKHATNNFVEEIKASKEYESYQKALSDFQAEKDTQKLLADFREAQQTLLILRQGGFTGIEEQERKLKHLQDKVSKNQKIQSLSKTQQTFQALIGELAGTISQAINFPFVQPQRGDCCG